MSHPFGSQIDHAALRKECQTFVAASQVAEGAAVLHMKPEVRARAIEIADTSLRYDLGRKVQGHLGLGVGLHACVGQAIARLEAEVLIATVARRVAAIELTGTPTYRLNNAVRALATLPLRVTAG